MPETAFAAVAVSKLLNNIKSYLLYRHEDHLGDALAWLNIVSFVAAIPAGNENLALVIRINKSGKVAQDQPDEGK